MTPIANDVENAPIPENGFVAQYPSIGLRDGQHEGDAFVNFSWVHTFNCENTPDHLAFLPLQQRQF